MTAGPRRTAAAASVSPRALTIAGSDSGGGAGIQADLKTFAAHGVYGLSAVTAVTAQNTREVRAVAAVPPAVVAAQIDAVLDDFGADAVKIGMLWSAATVRVVAERLRAWRRTLPLPVVLDPVLAAGSGAALLLPAEAVPALTVLLADLLPLATLVTPNLPELERLATLLPDAAAVGGAPPRLALARRLAACGPAVLAKGGHDPATGDEVVDWLLIPSGHPASGGAERIVRFAGHRLPARATHGTGCTLSAAVAARLAAGDDLVVAVGAAIEYVRQAMAAAPLLGGGPGPLAHFHGLIAQARTGPRS
jgi:hydroxymethylpyrimidine/phosphomethylpyrimidine kinase